MQFLGCDYNYYSTIFLSMLNYLYIITLDIILISLISITVILELLLIKYYILILVITGLWAVFLVYNKSLLIYNNILGDILVPLYVKIMKSLLSWKRLYKLTVIYILVLIIGPSLCFFLKIYIIYIILKHIYNIEKTKDKEVLKTNLIEILSLIIVLLLLKGFFLLVVGLALAQPSLEGQGDGPAGLGPQGDQGGEIGPGYIFMDAPGGGDPAGPSGPGGPGGPAGPGGGGDYRPPAAAGPSGPAGGGDSGSAPFPPSQPSPGLSGIEIGAKIETYAMSDYDALKKSCLKKTDYRYEDARFKDPRFKIVCNSNISSSTPNYPQNTFTWEELEYIKSVKIGGKYLYAMQRGNATGKEFWLRNNGLKAKDGDILKKVCKNSFKYEQVLNNRAALRDLRYNIENYGRGR